MLNKENKFIILAFVLVLTSGITTAGEVTTINPTDENGINEALKNGGTVYLNPGIYEIKGPIYIRSDTFLTGSVDAIIRVSSSSSQYFTGMTGIISSNGPVDNVEISGFQIDGNCDELPASYANSAPQYDHDAERAIIINGYTDQFCNNIIVRNMQIYDCFSDGIHIRMANNVKCYDNFISNCQHEGIFFTSIVNGEIFNNKIAGLTSDCVRCDNCVNVRVYKNILYSYTGGNSNGAYQGGQNGVQVANAGSSHGYDASNKPTTTTQVEVFDNVFANGMLNTVWVHSVDPSQVYVHDNKLMSGEELESMGMPAQSNVSYVNPPTKEMSEKIFSSIFDILDLTFSDTGRTEQKDEDIFFSVQETEQGTIAGGIKIIGFKDLIKIGNISYIPDENSILTKHAAVKAPSLNLKGLGVSNISKTIDTRIENGTAHAKLTVKMEYYTTVTNHATGKTKKRYYVSTAVFNDSCPAPEVLKRPTQKTGYINEYRNNITPNTRIYVESTGLQKIVYEYDGNITTHMFLIGERKTDTNGVEYTAFSLVDRWDGAIPNFENSLVIYGAFDPGKLNVTCYTPYESFKVTDFEHNINELPKNSWAKPLIGYLLRLILLLFCGYKLMRVIFP